ncbi:hypothetical protein AB1Y20_020684 [Prymnesium parvum]|uniref:Uncharacterized protein n=1 Tax=Prymnesium parvum TaxID=97485 RepID=A0AB34JY53_PRYPA
MEEVSFELSEDDLLSVTADDDMASDAAGSSSTPSAPNGQVVEVELGQEHNYAEFDEEDESWREDEEPEDTLQNEKQHDGVLPLRVSWRKPDDAAGDVVRATVLVSEDDISIPKQYVLVLADAPVASANSMTKEKFMKELHCGEITALDEEADVEMRARAAAVIRRYNKPYRILYGKLQQKLKVLPALEKFVTQVTCYTAMGGIGEALPISCGDAVITPITTTAFAAVFIVSMQSSQKRQTALVWDVEKKSLVHVAALRVEHVLAEDAKPVRADVTELREICLALRDFQLCSPKNACDRTRYHDVPEEENMRMAPRTRVARCAAGAAPAASAPKPRRNKPPPPAATSKRNKRTSPKLIAPPSRKKPTPQQAAPKQKVDEPQPQRASAGTAPCSQATMEAERNSLKELLREALAPMQAQLRERDHAIESLKQDIESLRARAQMPLQQVPEVSVAQESRLESCASAVAPLVRTTTHADGDGAPADSSAAARRQICIRLAELSAEEDHEKYQRSKERARLSASLQFFN